MPEHRPALFGQMRRHRCHDLDKDFGRIAHGSAIGGVSLAGGDTRQRRCKRVYKFVDARHGLVEGKPVEVILDGLERLVGGLGDGKRFSLERRRGRDWYEQRFLPRIGPVALYGLLFTIVVLFALQGEAVLSRPLDVARIALPLLAYFVLMFGGAFALGRLLGMSYATTTTLSFTAAGNNFELAIAVAIASFGVASGQALAGVVGPLIEVPVLVGLVYVALWAGRRWFPGDPTVPRVPTSSTAVPVHASTPARSSR